ncbi:hypothetical protein JCM10207_002078 [Rhodosporidiobolus poonsookiae]
MLDWLISSSSPPRAPPAPSSSSSSSSRSPSPTPLLSPSLNNPLLASVAGAATLAASYGIWHRYGRRIRTVDDLRPGDLSPRRLRGVVTRVGDADGFRLFHRPELRPLLKPPTGRAELTGETLSVRLAGVDAPEMAHFGKLEQPFAREAFDLLTKTLLNRRVTVEVFQKDRYNRAVANAYVRRWPNPLRRRSVSEILLEEGLATVYEQQGAVYGGRLAKLKVLETRARERQRGMWALGGKLESPAEYKRRYRGEKDAGL